MLYDYFELLLKLKLTCGAQMQTTLLDSSMSFSVMSILSGISRVNIALCKAFLAAHFALNFTKRIYHVIEQIDFKQYSEIFCGEAGQKIIILFTSSLVH